MKTEWQMDSREMIIFKGSGPEQRAYYNIWQFWVFFEGVIQSQWHIDRGRMTKIVSVKKPIHTPLHILHYEMSASSAACIVTHFFLWVAWFSSRSWDHVYCVNINSRRASFYLSLSWQRAFFYGNNSQRTAFFDRHTHKETETQTHRQTNRQACRQENTCRYLKILRKFSPRRIITFLALTSWFSFRCTIEVEDTASVQGLRRCSWEMAIYE